MTKLTAFAAALTLTLTAAGAQAASLSVGDNLMIESVNGKTTDAYSTQLPAGTHVVELRYSDLFAFNADDSGSWVRSGPLFATITLSQNETVTLTTDDIYSEQLAWAFVAEPQVTLESNKTDARQIALLDNARIMTQLLLKTQ